MSTPNTHIGAARIADILKNSKKLFFIGIGGVSMSSLAHITKKLGFSVAGSDRNETPITERLRSEGIEIFKGHSEKNIEGSDAVVYTVAISPDNPEYAEAVRLGLPLISRADYLGYIMTSKPNRLGISGMHGKSTCTGMCACVYTDSTVVSGAYSADMNGYYRIGSDDKFVFEACEYMDSFLDFNPTSAIILNIEPEHLDYFSGLDAINESFGKFAALTGVGGRVIYNIHDENIPSALKNYGGKKYTFGIDADSADYCAKNIVYNEGKPAFDIFKNGALLCSVKMSVAGDHNILNALATAAAADLDGISPDKISAGLESFKGVGRRMEHKGSLNGAVLYDDYGHHPTEIRATLAAARKMSESKELTVVFQPHTYTRTASLFDDFVSALSVADKVLLAPIYAARETDDLGVSSALLAKNIGEKASAFNNLEEIADKLTAYASANDFILVMGAGNVDGIFKLLNIK